MLKACWASTAPGIACKGSSHSQNGVGVWDGPWLYFRHAFCNLLCGMMPCLLLSHEEEDLTVLVSPEKPLRRGLSHRSNPNTGAPALQSVRFSLGPLSPEKLEEILDEANRLAAQLEECALQDREGAGAGPGKPSSRGKPSPRRETFVLKDSPVRDLLPTVSSWSTPSPSSLAGLRSSDKKGSTRAARGATGKKLPITKKVSVEG